MLSSVDVAIIVRVVVVVVVVVVVDRPSSSLLFLLLSLMCMPLPLYVTKLSALSMFAYKRLLQQPAILQKQVLCCYALMESGQQPMTQRIFLLLVITAITIIRKWPLEILWTKHFLHERQWYVTMTNKTDACFSLANNGDKCPRC